MLFIGFSDFLRIFSVYHQFQWEAERQGAEGARSAPFCVKMSLKDGCAQRTGA
jgi:hypothetical protein